MEKPFLYKEINSSYLVNQVFETFHMLLLSQTE